MNLHVSAANLHVSAANLHVSAVNLHVSAVNLHVSAVNLHVSAANPSAHAADARFTCGFACGFSCARAPSLRRQAPPRCYYDAVAVATTPAAALTPTLYSAGRGRLLRRGPTLQEHRGSDQGAQDSVQGAVG